MGDDTSIFASVQNGSLHAGVDRYVVCVWVKFAEIFCRKIVTPAQLTLDSLFSAKASLY